MNRKRPDELLLVSGVPILANAIAYWLEREPQLFRCGILEDLEDPLPSHASEPCLVMVAPEEWREMVSWLSQLQLRFPDLPWLLLADLRLAGLYYSALEMQRCTLVAPDASLEELQSALSALTSGWEPFPPAALLEFFSRLAPPAPDGETTLLTPKELQIGCAVSLGLTNREMAGLLHISHGTVKVHVHHVARKLQLGGREDLARYFARSLTWEAARHPFPRERARNRRSRNLR